MPRLIWVFAMRIAILLVLSCCSSITSKYAHIFGVFQLFLDRNQNFEVSSNDEKKKKKKNRGFMSEKLVNI